MRFALCLLYILALFGYCPDSSAQLIENKQINIPLNEEMNNEVLLIPLDEDGLLLMNEMVDNYARKPQIVLSKLDSTLNEKWTIVQPLEALYAYKTHYLTTNYLFILANHTDDLAYKVLRVDLQTGEVIVQEGRLLTRTTVEFFKVIGEKVWLGGELNGRAVVEQMNLLDKSAKVLPNLYANFLRVVAIESLPANNHALILVRDEKKCNLTAYEYDTEGRLLQTLPIGDAKHVPLSGKLVNVSADKSLLIGSYADNCSAFSVGLYLYDLTEPEKSTFHEFTKLSNYLNYLPQRRQSKLRSKIRQKQQQGKDFKIRQRLLLHDIKPTEKGWLLVGEVYYPEYNSNSLPLYYNYHLYRTGNQVYNQFNYSHVFVAEFDSTASLLWGNSVTLKNIISRSLDELAQVSPTDGGFLVAYPDKEVIKLGKLTPELPYQPLEVLNVQASKLPEQRSVDGFKPSLLAWYGQSFIAHGFQRLPWGGVTREVYTISKYSYQQAPERP